jgi:2-polyprenyl-6-methoxyphenol hydroxylase-like FAD-dependent oxidoreductase
METALNNNGNDTDILIVGAGPVGLFLANECARRGIRFRLIEGHPGQSAHSKALAIFPRTLEVFDMAGVVGSFLETANRVTSVNVSSHGRTVAQLPFEPAETPYPFVAMVPQNITEQLLVQELEKKGGHVEYQTRFVSAQQDENGVAVALERNNAPAALRTSFVIGCDGAHSQVRKGVNIPLEGGDYAADFMLADIETNAFHPASEMLLCPNEHGPVALFPMSATRWRMVATVEQVEGDAPDLGLVQKLLHDRAPAGIEPRDLHWSAYFRIHHRHAARMRDRRVLIAGDAAHIHSPFGGQGMNTGLHDVWNLIWKLDLFLHGHGNELLLESYAAERLPMIQSVIETTDRLTTALGTSNRIAQFVRDAVIPPLSHLEAFQQAFVRRLSGLGIAYQHSPIVHGSGARFFDATLRGGEGVQSRFLLQIGGDAPPAGQNDAERLCESLTEVLQFRKTPGSGIKLIRPDGYLAFSAVSVDHPALEMTRSLLEKQTR